VETHSFGHYRLLGTLGRGGMGQVFRAHDTKTDRVVALKVLPAHLAEDYEYQQRFRREARIAATLNDPHMVPIHNYGEIDGRLYVDMRLIEGRDLAQYIAEHGGRLSPDRAVTVVEQAAAALETAHAAGLIHRDIKPWNILVGSARDFVYLIDFGLARTAADTALTAAGHTMGTVAYMAPERFRGTTDHRADVYGLACVFHECLTGARPFPGDSFEEQLNGHLNTPPPRPSAMAPGVAPALDAVVARGLAKDPAQRYQSAVDLATAARGALARAAAWHPPPPGTPAPQRLLGRARPVAGAAGSRRLVFGLVGLSVLALIAVTALVVMLLTRNSNDNRASSPEPAPRPHPRVPATSSSLPASAAPSGDYTNLLIQASDIGADTTLGPPQQNPGGVPGAAVTFSNDARTHTVVDLLVVLEDPGSAAAEAKDRPPSLGKYVTGTPQPFPLGTNGVMVVGPSPDKSKAVTYVVFAEGKVVVDLEFDGPPSENAPQDFVLDLARKQDEAVKNRMRTS
jgi:serine/threonine protein kinase